MGAQDRSAEGLVKVLFSLDQDEDGYPPVTSETLWARRTPEGLYELDNIPFYAQGVSWKDIVAAEPNTEGMLEFQRVAKPSGHSTIRIVASEKNEMTKVQQELERLGCSWEGSNQPSLISVDVPPEVDLQQIWNFLRTGLDEGRWDYEDASIQHRASQ